MMMGGSMEWQSNILLTSVLKLLLVDMLFDML